MNLWAWLKNFKIEDDDLAWFEAMWKSREKRQQRDQGLVIKAVALIITRFLLVARHREDVVRRGSRKDAIERADAIKDAIEAFTRAHQELRRAGWAYHDALPDVYTAETMGKKRKRKDANGGE